MKNIKGFTLIELSIVLIIIGLIAGGVVTGANLVRNAKLNRIISDFQKFDKAVTSFKTYYGQLPGDFNNAATYWPTECTDQANDACNGDGDGNILRETSPSNNMERLRSWQHLALAGEIEGSWPGYNGSQWDECSPSTNPAGPDDGQLYDIRYGAGGAIWGSNASFEILIIGNYRSGAWPSAGALTSTNSYYLDQKLDDTHPQQGILTSTAAVPAPTLTCHNGSSYTLSNDSEKSCVTIYRLTTQN